MRSEHKRGRSYAGYLIGAVVAAIGIAVGEYSNHPELIRPMGYVIGIFASIGFVLWSRFATRLWFWATLLFLACIEFAVLSRFSEQFDRVSAALTIPLGILAGVANIILLFIVGAQFEDGWKKPNRETARGQPR